VKNIFIILSAAFFLITVSCATVIFDVEHPPEIDFRGAGKITIIPFEKNSSFRYERFSPFLTSALAKSAKNYLIGSSIDFIEPEAIKEIPEKDIWKYADIFITGRINNITSSAVRRKISEQSFGDRVTITEEIDYYVTVDIEYSYIRSKDGKILGNYRKSETVTDVTRTERIYYETENRNNAGQNRRNNSNQNSRNQRRHGNNDELFHDGSHSGYLVFSAIENLSYSINKELSPWTSTEKRKLRKQNDDISAGYNAAILLAADGKYAEALNKLENLQKQLIASQRNTPRFLQNEIIKMTVFANGLKALEEYRKNRQSMITQAKESQAQAEKSASVPSPNTREIKGIVNLNLVTVYALKEPITGSKDNSVWTKIAASAKAGTPEGRWSMSLPSDSPSSLWFAVSDGKTMYITKAAINTSVEIKLDTEQMIKLE